MFVCTCVVVACLLVCTVHACSHVLCILYINKHLLPYSYGIFWRFLDLDVLYCDLQIYINSIFNFHSLITSIRNLVITVLINSI